MKNFFAKAAEFIRVFFHYANTQIVRNPRKLIPVFILSLFFLYDEILLRLFTGQAFFPHLFYPVFFGISLGLGCTGFALLFSRKTAKWISNIILIVLAVLFIAECLIKNSFQTYIPLGSVFAGAAFVTNTYSGTVWNTLFHAIPIILFYLLPVGAFTRWGIYFIPKKKFKTAFALELLLFSLLLFWFSLAAVYIGGSGDSYKKQYTFGNATESFGLLTGTRLDLKYRIFGGNGSSYVIHETEPETTAAAVEAEAPKVYGKNVMDINFDRLSQETSDSTIKEINQYVSSLVPSSQNDYTGLFAGKNLILICAESFSNLIINERTTPTLYRLQHNGIYFSEYYQPYWGGSTSAGEFAYLTGLVPTNSVETMTEDSLNLNNYFTLGSQLQRQNYYSLAMHNGEYNYYDRQDTHPNLGYDTWLGLGNGLEEITDKWPGDYRFLDLTFDVYKDNAPFSIYMMTMSGHFPYDLSNPDYEDLKKYLPALEAEYGDRYQDTTMAYFCYNMELEKGLEALVLHLEESGLADDTVICLTGDHYPYGLSKSDTFGNDQDYLSDLYGFTPKYPWEQDQNTWILWSGCLENEHKDMACEISEPTSSLDIVPTLSNLFGLEYDSRLLPGRDVFSDTEALVLWFGHGWVTSEGKYDAVTKTFLPNNIESSTDQAYITRINQIVDNKINYSMDAVNTDYFGYLVDFDFGHSTTTTP